MDDTLSSKHVSCVLFLLIHVFLPRYEKGLLNFVSKSLERAFFRLPFRNCKSCVYNREDLHSYNSLLRNSHTPNCNNVVIEKSKKQKAI